MTNWNIKTRNSLRGSGCSARSNHPILLTAAWLPEVAQLEQMFLPKPFGPGKRFPIMFTHSNVCDII